jgi:Pyruvate/2-oxoacid:ferredoxin oxidoreductase delta subunit
MIHASARSLENFSRALADIYSVRPPDLTVMDAVVGMEGNGPSSGKLRWIPGFKSPSKTLVKFITPLTSWYYDFLAVKPHLNRKKCVRCWECAEKCPVSALRRNEYPHITKECVSCFCCVEVCENHAMEGSSRARDLFNRSLLKI